MTSSPDNRDVVGFDLGDLSGITITVGEPLPPHAQQLMDTLGVTVRVVHGAPTKPPADWMFVDSHAKRFRNRR